MRVVAATVVVLVAAILLVFALKVKRNMDKATSTTPPVDALAERRKWIEFASRLLNLCVEIQRTSDVLITEKEFAEPKILALALLARTYMNLKGVIAVAKEGLVVEARTLARSCFENLFFVPNLIEKGDEFVTAMYDHERRSIRSQGEFLLEDLDYLDPFGAELANQLKARLRKIKDLRPKAKLLNVKEVAGGSAIKPAYVFYSQLSADAAHPTIRALKRHLIQTVENGERVLGLDIHPVERGAEVADTVNIACNAVLGVCVAVNQILGGTAANELLNKLFVEYEAMNRTAKAEDSQRP
jgi:hypothetical protein